MSRRKLISTPLTADLIASLNAGDLIYLSGKVYTARDAAHKRMHEMLQKSEPMPFDFTGQVVYYAGPSPTKPGDVIGSVGPTTAERMDAYVPDLMAKGLIAMIGKGLRTPPVVDAIIKYKGVYLAAIGGAAAHMAQCIKAVENIAFEDLGTEAIRLLTVENMPLIVAVDSKGKGVYFGHASE